MTTILIAVAVCVVVALAWRVSRIGAAGPRPEATLRVPATPETVESLLASGQKIEAIKLLRRETGLGLKEAKDAVERLPMRGEEGK